MKCYKFFTIVIIILSHMGIIKAQNTIDGNAYLEFQTNYSGIQVLFERTAPTSLIDSAYTDISGYYNISLPGGIYNVTFSHNNYIPLVLTDQIFFSNITLSDTTLETVGLIGNLSGTILPGMYKVGANIMVDTTDTLVILPGAQFLFKQDIQFDIHGYLIANGNISDSIIFTAYDSSITWGGIIFNQTINNNSIISYATIKNSNNSGLQIIGSSPSIQHTNICNNSFDATNGYDIGGGGVYMINSDANFSNVNICNNQCYIDDFSHECGGGGIFMYNSNPIFDSIEVVNNTLVSFPFGHANGAGIYCRNGSPIISNSLITANSGSYRGGGIYCNHSIGMQVKNTIINNNICVAEGGGIADWYSDLQITNSLIVKNTAGYGGGVTCIASTTRIYNSTIANNHANYLAGGIQCSASNPPIIVNSIISMNNNYGITSGGPPYPSIQNCDVSNNTPENFYSCGQWTGLNLTINMNGDSCDVYENIQMDPMFIDTMSNNYHLQVNSPCLDAGVNDSVFTTLDLDGNPRISDNNGDGDTIVNMGAYESGITKFCLPAGIAFTTQAEIDNFNNNHPACNEIEGDVEISGIDITNLNGLNVLTAFGGDLTIGGNTSLSSLTGLDNITSIGGGLKIWGNSSLVSLTGLDNLINIGGYLYIEDNTALTSLSGLNNLTSIGGYIFLYLNHALISLTGLDNVTSINGDIEITINNGLTSLTGMDNIDPTSIADLYIYDNMNLSTCEVVSICDFLDIPNSYGEIYDNKIGCNSKAEVQAACLTVSIENINFNDGITIFPNPTKNTLTISNNSRLIIREIMIYDLASQKVLQTKPLNNIIDVSKLQPGMYIIELISSELKIREKLIIR